MTGENKMRFAIVESGGKQYRAVEGSTIDVDRLAYEVGKAFDFDRVLLMADGDAVMVGTPAVEGIKVSATVVDHVKGPKVISFKYRPKKRIRVKGGHRHQYTRLMIDFIGKPGDIPGLTAGVGMIVWGGEAGRGGDVDIFSVGLGAKVGFAPPQLMGIGIDGKFFYGPKILTTGDSDRVFESGLRVSYAIIPKVRCFVEYQKIHVDFDGGGDGDIDDDLRIGFEAKF
jgi:large subunit ribosomal protein L21